MTFKPILAILVAAAIVLGTAGSATAASSAKCPRASFPQNQTYSYYVAARVVAMTCADAKQLAGRWYAAVDADAIPRRVFLGQHGEFGPAQRLNGWSCRVRSIISDLGEVRCARGRAVALWSQHHDTRAMAVPYPQMTQVLGAREARAKLGEILVKRLGPADGWYGTRIHCTRRSRLKIGCAVSWIIGDSEFSGTGRVWLTRHGPGWYATHAYARITYVDSYCVNVTHGPHCTHVYRIHG